MDWIYIIAEYTVAIEFILIGIIIITTYCFRLYEIVNSKHKSNVTLQIEKYLTTLMQHPEMETKVVFPPQGKQLGCLLAILHEYDINTKESNWQKTRLNFIRSIILPLARIAATSRKWSRRCYASEAFTYYSEKEDEIIILGLLNDKFPLVAYNGLLAAVLQESEIAIDTVINLMAKHTWYSQMIFYQAFDKVTSRTAHLILKKLKFTLNDQEKIICYRILHNYIPLKINWDINSDINSNNLWLKLNALDYISNADKDSALPFLIDSLEDKNWQIRASSLNCLSKIKAKHVIPEITHCLHDNHWAVGRAAVIALYNYGEEGRKVLDELNIEMNPLLYQVAQHISYES